ncbi:DUF2911 domain-containing protein [Polaribacter undariae]|uniref:DUF2911 domain-containing protein n=1 Tax=Polaribacter sejongensis TaxID=985043 RepID=A0AAJ1VG42_9FLAO|nr:DUF2911 domain-containing protein [Polaribacter undariae]MDN3617967.1 DUF2911 domain-containing protein [Polaribacter undariae]UWD32001.1 DUF2911 domain-containing protein [Polaribacter undariae]
MNRIILSLFVAVFTLTVNAQITTPQPSPLQKIEQIVGLTDITVEYSRPGVKGRTIFGDLVPFNEIWRTGANGNTKITFSTDVTIDGNKIEKGSYTIFSVPTEKSWDIVIYEETKSGTPKKLDETKIVAKMNVPTQNIPMVIETFTISFDDMTTNSAVLGIMWENTYVGFKIEAPVEEMVTKQITTVMNGPSANDYYAAAVYYLENGKDIKKAQTWIDKSVEMMSDSPKFWVLRRQALIHAKAGNKESAIKAAKESLKLAEKAENAGYIKMNTESLKEWGAM